jgi:hypothetical protein
VLEDDGRARHRACEQDQRPHRHEVECLNTGRRVRCSRRERRSRIPIPFLLGWYGRERLRQSRAEMEPEQTRECQPAPGPASKTIMTPGTRSPRQPVQGSSCSIRKEKVGGDVFGVSVCTACLTQRLKTWMLDLPGAFRFQLRKRRLVPSNCVAIQHCGQLSLVPVE